MRNKYIPVAILGATGAVGQKLIRLIENHEKFHVSELSSSSRNTGKKYASACTWRESSSLPNNIANMILKSADDIKANFILSALPADIALNTETMLAQKGKWVISNASAHRMKKNIPLVIPEVNPDHLRLLESQTTAGKIITNPNCSTIFIALALKPLMLLGKIEHVSIVTMQAISGAGYPGIPACDILGNIIPNIPGEEQKIESELRKILGEKSKPQTFEITVHTNRVPVLHGHTTVLHVRFNKEISEKNVRKVFQDANKLHYKTYNIHKGEQSPQPRQDLSDTDNRVHIGHIKISSDGLTVGLITMGHNLVRGAAGAAILNLEAILEYKKKSD